MKVYFHEDQLKDDSPPQLAIAPKDLPKNKEKSKSIAISPLVSVLAMVAIGIGAYAIEHNPGAEEDTNLAYTPLTIEEDVPVTKPVYKSSIVSPQQVMVTQPITITPALPRPVIYENPYLTSTKEITTLPIEETVAQEPSPIESRIEIPTLPVRVVANSEKSVSYESAPATVVLKTNEEVKPMVSEPVIQGSKMERARILFSRQKYFEACALSRLEMNNGNKAQRHEAVIMTAQCYLQLGYKPTAQHLLEFVISEGGPGKKDAKRILAESQK